jgi:hypothetical protein
MPSLGVKPRRRLLGLNMAQRTCEAASFNEKYQWPDAGTEKLEISPSTHIKGKLPSKINRTSRFKRLTVKISSDWLMSIGFIWGDVITCFLVCHASHLICHSRLSGNDREQAAPNFTYTIPPTFVYNASLILTGRKHWGINNDNTPCSRRSDLR